MIENLRYHWTYLLWLVLYVIPFAHLATLFEVTTVYIALIVFGVFLFSYIVVYQYMWRVINGIRPLRLNKEKEKLLPLFAQVYKKAIITDKKLSKKIKLYIAEDMNINTIAFCETSLILTKGSTMLLSDDNIKGLIAHELGHFSTDDGVYISVMKILVLPLTLIMWLLRKAKKATSEDGKSSFSMGILKGLVDVIYYPFKGLEFVIELLVMYQRRESEYRADMFALKIGYGAELAEVLVQLYEISLTKKTTVKEMLRATHPHITKRIERLEKELHRLQM